MKITCANNSSHNEFYVMAHVSEEWKVDAEGNFLERVGFGEVVHDPDVDDLFTCAKCGAEAIAKK